MRTGPLGVHKGGSLLEVLIALVLVALTMVGAVSSQLHAATVERLTGERERALTIAASVATAMRDRLSGSHALARWQVHAAAALPGAEVSVVDRAPDVALVVVRWAAQRPEGRALLPARGGCEAESATAGLACVAVPFVR